MTLTGPPRKSLTSGEDSSPIPYHYFSCRHIFPVTAGILGLNGLDIKHAEKWARDVEGEMDRGIFTSRTKAERTTLFEAFERYCRLYRPDHADRETRKARALQRRALATRSMSSIRTKDIAVFIRERK